MASIMWDAELARHYDQASAEMFDPAVLGPTVDVLAELARAGGAAAGRARRPGRRDRTVPPHGGLEQRWSAWDKSPFTAASTTQIAVYLKP